MWGVFVGEVYGVVRVYIFTTEGGGSHSYLSASPLRKFIDKETCHQSVPNW